jgi:hypothetical protein
MYNFCETDLTGTLIKKMSGLLKRSIPTMFKTTLRSWYKVFKKAWSSVTPPLGDRDKVYLFCDEFIASAGSEGEYLLKPLQLLEN